MRLADQFPALILSGEFVGGADIVREMYEQGELQKLLQSALGLDAFKTIDRAAGNDAEHWNCDQSSHVMLRKNDRAARTLYYFDVRDAVGIQICHYFSGCVNDCR